MVQSVKHESPQHSHARVFGFKHPIIIPAIRFRGLRARCGRVPSVCSAPNCVEVPLGLVSLVLVGQIVKNLLF